MLHIYESPNDIKIIFECNVPFAIFGTIFVDLIKVYSSVEQQSAETYP